MSDSGLIGKGYKEYYTDFSGATIIGTSTTAAGIELVNSSDGSDTAFVELVHADGPKARAATAATDNNMCELAHRSLSWSAQNGMLSLETRVKFDVVTTLAFTVGFNDDALEDSNSLPMELSGTTWTSNAASWIGFVFDVDATNDDVHVMWVDDDSDESRAIADLRMNGIAPVAGEWFGVSLVLNDRGSGNGVYAEFTFVEESTGKRAQKTFKTTLDRDVLLTPHIGFENRDAVAHQCDVDYIRVKQSRATTN